MLRTGEECIEEMRAYLAERYPAEHGEFFECTDEEGSAAFLNRFASGGAVVRYRAVHPRTVEAGDLCAARCQGSRISSRAQCGTSVSRQASAT